MLKEALDKLQAEITAGGAKKPYLPVIGGFIMDRIRTNPEEAELVLGEGKTLAGALGAMKEEARKNQADGCGVLTDEQGFAIVLKYYGIRVPEAAPEPVAVVAPAIKTSLDDLF